MITTKTPEFLTCAWKVINPSLFKSRARFVGVGGSPSGASQPPKFSLTPTISVKNTLLTSGFTTNRVLFESDARLLEVIVIFNRTR